MNCVLFTNLDFWARILGYNKLDKEAQQLAKEWASLPAAVAARRCAVESGFPLASSPFFRTARQHNDESSEFSEGENQEDEQNKQEAVEVDTKVFNSKRSKRAVTRRLQGQYARPEMFAVS